MASELVKPRDGRADPEDVGLLDVAARLAELGYEPESQRDLMHWVNRFEVQAPGGEPVWFSGEPEAAGEPPYAVWRARDLSDEVLVVNSDEECVRLVVEALGGTSVRRRRTVLGLRDDSYLGTDADMECQEPGCSADAVVVVHVRGGGPAGEFETPLCQDHEHVYEDRSWVRDCWERARRRPLGWEFTR